MRFKNSWMFDRWSYVHNITICYVSFNIWYSHWSDSARYYGMYLSQGEFLLFVCMSVLHEPCSSKHGTQFWTFEKDVQQSQRGELPRATWDMPQLQDLLAAALEKRWWWGLWRLGGCPRRVLCIGWCGRGRKASALQVLSGHGGRASTFQIWSGCGGRASALQVSSGRCGRASALLVWSSTGSALGTEPSTVSGWPKEGNDRQRQRCVVMTHPSFS